MKEMRFIGWLWVLFTTAMLIFSSAVACLFPVAAFPSLKGSFKHIGVDRSFWDLDHQVQLSSFTSFIFEMILIFSPYSRRSLNTSRFR